MSAVEKKRRENRFDFALHPSRKNRAVFREFLRRFRNGKHFNSRRDSIDALKSR
jgi:hypothetical protein